MTPAQLAALAARLSARSPKRIDDPGAQRAAVAAVLRERDGEVEVLLIRRADRPGDAWSGQMAFPGGRADPSDRDLLETAIRETREEVGLDLDARAILLGPLDEVIPRNRGGLVVAPYAFALYEPEVALTPNAEVAEVRWARTAPLARGDAATHHPLSWNGLKLKMPAYRVGDRIVWGMTYFVLAGLVALATE